MSFFYWNFRFMGAQVLQAIGESMEPVLFAMVRDCFSDSSQRFTMIAALQMMAFVGAPWGRVFESLEMVLAPNSFKLKSFKESQQRWTSFTMGFRFWICLDTGKLPGLHRFAACTVVSSKVWEVLLWRQSLGASQCSWQVGVCPFLFWQSFGAFLPLWRPSWSRVAQTQKNIRAIARTDLLVLKFPDCGQFGEADTRNI